MQRCLALLAAVIQLASSPQTRLTFAMKTGILLRMHVIAQDDTPAMQQVKYAVRDAACDAYAACADPARTMQDNAQAHLPAIAAAAQNAAVQAGFSGQVAVTIERRAFDTRSMDGLDIPAGVYPALMIRLGDARGRNWWGLIDQELALRCAAITLEDEGIVWDWSAAGLLAALAGLFFQTQEAP